MTSPEPAMMVPAPVAPDLPSASVVTQQDGLTGGTATHAPVLSLDCLDDATRVRAERAMFPGGYRISGVVLTHPVSQRLIIADRTGYRGLGTDDMQRIMAWEMPQEPAARSTDDESHVEPVAVPARTDAPDLRPAAPVRPLLATAPTRAMLDSVEGALAELARECGCIFNEDIAHNAGWFVPGKPTAFASPYDAIRAIVDRSPAAGPVGRAAAAPRKARATAVKADAMLADAATPACTAEEQAQGGLF